jgi:hypothetical protein
MRKTDKELLEKLDRIVLFLTERRLASDNQEDWDACNMAAVDVRNCRRAVAGELHA